MTRNYTVVHDAKLEALDDLIEELDGAQLLLAYNFQHDRARIRARYKDDVTIFEGNEKQTQAIVDQWNRGEIKFLACHPTSAGHGLNLQGSSCAHVAWFSPPWDFELFDQFIRRIRRQGNEAQRIVNHILVMTDSIDEIALQALSDKDTTQGRLVKALNSEFLQDGGAPASGAELERQERLSNMVLKLGRQTDVAQPAQPVPMGGQHAQPQGNGNGSAGKLPAGWGSVAAQPNQEEAAQRERVREQLTTGGAQPMDTGTSPNAGKAMSAFSTGVQQTHAVIADGAILEEAKHRFAAGVQQARGTISWSGAEIAPIVVPEATVKRTRRKADAPEAALATITVTPFRAGHEVRLGVLKLAVEQCDGGSLDDALELAKQFLEFVEGE